MLCKGITTNGGKCQRITDHKYCWQHKNVSRKQSGGADNSKSQTTCTLKNGILDCNSSKSKIRSCRKNSDKKLKTNFTYSCNYDNTNKYNCKSNDITKDDIPEWICDREIKEYEDKTVKIINYDKVQLYTKGSNPNSNNLVSTFKIDNKEYKVDYKNGMISQGAFGTVYKFLDGEKNTSIIKVIPVQSTKKQQLDEIKNEIQISEYLSDFCDPYLLCSFHYFSKDNIFYTISEYLGNYSTVFDLAKVIDISIHEYENANLNSNSRKKIYDYLSLFYFKLHNIMLKLAKGLKVLHDMGIIHNDIHHGNIMISYDLDHIKYIDFGLSCFKNKCNNRRLNGLIYSRDPETVVKDKQNILLSFENYAAKDMWSLGILYYFILTRRYYIKLAVEILLISIESYIYLDKQIFDEFVKNIQENKPNKSLINNIIQYFETITWKELYVKNSTKQYSSINNDKYSKFEKLILYIMSESNYDHYSCVKFIEVYKSGEYNNYSNLVKFVNDIKYELFNILVELHMEKNDKFPTFYSILSYYDKTVSNNKLKITPMIKKYAPIFDKIFEKSNNRISTDNLVKNLQVMS